MKQFIFVFSVISFSAHAMNNQQISHAQAMHKCIQEIKLAQEKVQEIDSLLDQCTPISTDLHLKKELRKVIESTWAVNGSSFSENDYKEKKEDFKKIFFEEIDLRRKHIAYLANLRLIFTTSLESNKAKLKQYASAL